MGLGKIPHFPSPLYGGNVKVRLEEYTARICYVQSMDLDNPWLALGKPWIHALHNNPWIVCTNCGSMLCAIQSQVPLTKETGRNRREGLPCILCRSGGNF